MVSLLAKEGKRESLIALLAKRCPEKPFMYLGIEDCLIILYQKELNDGTSVLCDAFDQSKDSKARKVIAAALRRGFRAMGITDSGDDELVKNIRNWYRINAREYEPNMNYLGHWSTPGFSYESVGVLARRGEGRKGAGPLQK